MSRLIIVASEFVGATSLPRASEGQADASSSAGGKFQSAATTQGRGSTARHAASVLRKAQLPSTPTDGRR